MGSVGSSRPDVWAYAPDGSRSAAQSSTAINQRMKRPPNVVPYHEFDGEARLRPDIDRQSHPLLPLARPLRIVGEVIAWRPHAPDQLQAMKDHLARLKAEGVEAID